MTEQLARAQDMHQRIREILLRDWDPIGVQDFPGAQDEYDGYVPSVYKQVIRKASQQEIFDYLWQLETEHMGLRGDRQKTEQIAERLAALAK